MYVIGPNDTAILLIPLFQITRTNEEGKAMMEVLKCDRKVHRSNLRADPQHADQGLLQGPCIGSLQCLLPGDKAPLELRVAHTTLHRTCMCSPLFYQFRQSLHEPGPAAPPPKRTRLRAVLSCCMQAARQFLLLAHLYARTDSSSLAWLRRQLVEPRFTPAQVGPGPGAQEGWAGCMRRNGREQPMVPANDLLAFSLHTCAQITVGVAGGLTTLAGASALSK